MRNLVFLFVLLAFSFVQCANPKADSPTGKDLQQDIKPRPELEIQDGYMKVEPERFKATERALAAAKLEKYYKLNPEPMQMLVSQLFEIDFSMVVNDESTENRRAGEWLDFTNEFTYTWNKYDSLMERGKYHYTLDSDILLMLSDNEDHFPSEWTVKSAGNTIVLVGTSTFKNNNTQLHMVARDERPKKP